MNQFCIQFILPILFISILTLLRASDDAVARFDQHVEAVEAETDRDDAENPEAV